MLVGASTRRGTVEGVDVTARALGLLDADQRAAMVELARASLGGRRAIVAMAGIDSDRTRRLCTALALIYGSRPGWRTAAEARLAPFLARPAAASTGARDIAAAIQRAGLRDLTFRPEAGEIVQTPATTLLDGAGDCDDHAQVIAADCQAFGLPWRMSFAGQRRQNAPPLPFHIFTEAQVDGQWLPLETCDRRVALFEHPVAFMRRVGIRL